MHGLASRRIWGNLNLCPGYQHLRALSLWSHRRWYAPLVVNGSPVLLRFHDLGRQNGRWTSRRPGLSSPSTQGAFGSRECPRHGSLPTSLPIGPYQALASALMVRGRRPGDRSPGLSLQCIPEDLSSDPVQRPRIRRLFSRREDSGAISNPLAVSGAEVATKMKTWARYGPVIKANWHHGFTCFGGPAVQFQTVSFPAFRSGQVSLLKRSSFIKSLLKDSNG